VARTGQQQGAHGLPTNHLRGCLLLLVAEAPSHGYELLERAHDLLPLPLDGGRVQEFRMRARGYRPLG